MASCATTVTLGKAESLNRLKIQISRLARDDKKAKGQCCTARLPPVFTYIIRIINPEGGKIKLNMVWYILI